VTGWQKAGQGTAVGHWEELQDSVYPSVCLSFLISFYFLSSFALLDAVNTSIVTSEPKELQSQQPECLCNFVPLIDITFRLRGFVFRN
jgi:hypothetical protein